MPEPVTAPPPLLTAAIDIPLGSAPPIPSLGHVTAQEVHSALAVINRGRFKLLTRVSALRLFNSLASNTAFVTGEQHNVDDHPMISTILRLRDEYESLPPEKTSQRIAVLGTLFEMLQKTVRMGEEAADSLRSTLQSHLELEQRKKEHEDKMQFLRDRLAGAGITMDALQDMAGRLDDEGRSITAGATDNGVAAGSLFDTLPTDITNAPSRNEPAQAPANAAHVPDAGAGAGPPP